MTNGAIVELYYSGDWHDVTASDDVYDRDPITITRGPGDSEQTPPSTMTFTLENRDGKYSPRNPTSELYGVIGRNTPVRCSKRLITDTFSRTASNSWGSTDTGQAYTNAWSGTGSGNDFDVAAGVGTHLISVANEARVSLLSTVVLRDVEAVVTVAGIPANVTNATVDTALMLRMAGINGPGYFCNVRVTTTEAVQLEVWHVADGGVFSLIDSTTVAGLTSAGTLRFRAQVEGQVIRAKVWLPSAGEPFAWQLEVTDDRVTEPGGVAIRSGVSSGNTNVPITFTYDNLEIRLPRFHGEIEALPLAWTVEGADVWASVTAAGIMRRLNALGTRTKARSAMVRALVLMAPLGYWPMEDGSAATVAASALTNGAALVTSGTVDFSASEGPPGSLPLCGNLTADEGALHVPDIVPDETQTWQFALAFKSDADVSAILVEWYDPTDAVTPYWNIEYTEEADGLIVSAYDELGALTITSALDLAVGEWHTLVWRQESDGSRTLYADGVAWPADGGDEGVSGPPRNLTLAPYRPDLFLGEAIALGHFAIWDNIDADPADIHDAMLGHAGETVAARIERVCSQDGLPVVVIGDAEALVGPQRAVPTLDIVRDAVNVDGGILYEPRGAFGLAVRTLATLYNQTPALTANYAAGGEVSPPLVPLPDTHAVVNDVTVKRFNGSSARVVQESGPLNVNEPTDDPQGVGRYPEEIELNLYSDAQCLNHASWRKHLGTWDEERFQAVNFDLAAMAAESKTDLANAAACLDVGDRFVIEDPPAWLPPEDIELHALGFTEVLPNKHAHRIAVNATPARPYNIGTVDGGARFDPPYGNTVTDEALDTTETGVNIVSTGVRWVDSTNYAAEFPLTVIIGGEAMTVTAISGTGLTQVMTVTRSANGVVKSHAAGTPVHLLTTHFVGL